MDSVSQNKIDILNNKIEQYELKIDELGTNEKLSEEVISNRIELCELKIKECELKILVLQDKQKFAEKLQKEWESSEKYTDL